jgi:hypothetical protein
MAMKQGFGAPGAAHALDGGAHDRKAAPAVEVIARSLSPTAGKLFAVWTIAWWGGVGVCGALFFFGVLDFASSAKLSLYGISIWLNGWLMALVARRYSEITSVFFSELRAMLVSSPDHRFYYGQFH